MGSLLDKVTHPTYVAHVTRDWEALFIFQRSLLFWYKIFHALLIKFIHSYGSRKREGCGLFRILVPGRDSRCKYEWMWINWSTGMSKGGWTKACWNNYVHQTHLKCCDWVLFLDVIDYYSWLGKWWIDGYWKIYWRQKLVAQYVRVDVQLQQG